MSERFCHINEFKLYFETSEDRERMGSYFKWSMLSVYQVDPKFSDFMTSGIKQLVIALSIFESNPMYKCSLAYVQSLRIYVRNVVWFLSAYVRIWIKNEFCQKLEKSKNAQLSELQISSWKIWSSSCQNLKVEQTVIEIKLDMPWVASSFWRRWREISRHLIMLALVRYLFSLDQILFIFVPNQKMPRVPGSAEWFWSWYRSWDGEMSYRAQSFLCAVRLSNHLKPLNHGKKDIQTNY